MQGGSPATKKTNNMKTFCVIAFGIIATILTGNATPAIILTTFAIAPHACKWLEQHYK